MPANTVQSVNNAIYYKVIPSKKYILNIKDKQVTKESPAICRYNPNSTDEDKNEFISTSFGGHLASIKIGDKKTGTSKSRQPYEIQDLFLEFHSIDKGNLVREMVSMPWGRSLTFAVVGKLATCKDFSNINLEFDRYMSKETGKFNSVAKVYEGIPMLEDATGRISIFISDEKWRKNSEQVVLPQKLWGKKEGKTTSFIESYDEALASMIGDKKPELDPDYEIELKAIYEPTVEAINAKLSKLQDYEAPQRSQQSNVSDEEYYVQDETLPEINLDEVRVQTPF